MVNGTKELNLEITRLLKKYLENKSELCNYLIDKFYDD